VPRDKRSNGSCAGLGRVSKFAVQVLDPPENLPGNSEKTKKSDVEEGEDASEDVLGKLQACGSSRGIFGSSPGRFSS